MAALEVKFQGRNLNIYFETMLEGRDTEAIRYKRKSLAYKSILAEARESLTGPNVASASESEEEIEESGDDSTTSEDGKTGENEVFNAPEPENPILKYLSALEPDPVDVEILGRIVAGGKTTDAKTTLPERSEGIGKHGGDRVNQLRQRHRGPNRGRFRAAARRGTELQKFQEHNRRNPRKVATHLFDEEPLDGAGQANPDIAAVEQAYNETFASASPPDDAPFVRKDHEVPLYVAITKEEVRIALDGSRNTAPGPDRLTKSDPLSPCLFNLLMDELIEAIPSEAGVKIDGGASMAVAAYADDLLLVVNSRAAANDLSKMTTQFLDQRSMLLNPGKCTALSVGTSGKSRKTFIFSRPLFYINGSPIPCITPDGHFKYLEHTYGYMSALRLTLKDLLPQLKRLRAAPLKPIQKMTLL